MNYEGSIIRPPSEADSILLQVTRGCSHNRCTFCAAYKDVSFRIKDDAVIEKDLQYAALNCMHQNRVFLCDGDALIIPHARLTKILAAINRYLPWVHRVGTYANAKSIARISDDELAQLQALGLKIIHMGLESGVDETLRNVDKWGDAAAIIEQGCRLRKVGISLFVTALLGLGGKERSEIHAEQTGRALTAMDPDYVGVLTLMLVPGTKLYQDAEAGVFNIPSASQMLRELRIMLEHTSLSSGIFYANHASNYIPLRVRLPRGKGRALQQIDEAIRGEIPITPEWLRGL